MQFPAAQESAVHISPSLQATGVKTQPLMHVSFVQRFPSSQIKAGKRHTPFSQESIVQALLSLQVMLAQSAIIRISPLLNVEVAVTSLTKFTGSNSTTSIAVGEFPKLTTACCPALPTKAKRIEKITAPLGTVTPTIF